MIVIYSKENCPFCVQAIQLAEAKEIKHTIMKIGVDISTDDFHNMFPNARTVPQIHNVDVKGNEYIGGYKEFNNWVLSKAIGEMGI